MLSNNIFIDFKVLKKSEREKENNMTIFYFH